MARLRSSLVRSAPTEPSIPSVPSAASATLDPVLRPYLHVGQIDALLDRRDMILREATRLWENSNAFLMNINRQYDDQFAQSGAKIGETLRIRLPNDYTVRRGATAKLPAFARSRFRSPSASFASSTGALPARGQKQRPKCAGGPTTSTRRTSSSNAGRRARRAFRPARWPDRQGRCLRRSCRRCRSRSAIAR